MYKLENFERELNVKEYLEKYVNIEEFLQYCKECRNYEKSWACPSFDFDVEEYWKKYESLYLTANKIIFDEGTTQEEGLAYMMEVKGQMSQDLFKMEKEFPGSISLSAGSCNLCEEGDCTRIKGEPCRYPDKMRHSIESLGGNVGLTVSKLMGIELEWMEEGKMPSFFVLVGGLLKK